eukprot:TRINITY_DN17647_c0_g1_i1.p1 TRINITY_DN17647_c0_g1~~TRINITY_DN17647_c0_g1_i1.p1  ORF type:complete len:106 (-),score=4.04 TRINITY_DN17647_c0_g1_i1:14-331(-)
MRSSVPWSASLEHSILHGLSSCLFTSSQMLWVVPARARYRARNTRWRKPPPLRGIPLTPRLPRPPSQFEDKDWWVDRRSLVLPERPPGLKSDVKPPPPEKYIDKK